MSKEETMGSTHIQAELSLFFMHLFLIMPQSAIEI